MRTSNKKLPYSVLYSPTREKLEREEIARKMLAKKRADICNNVNKICDISPEQVKSVLTFACMYVCMYVCTYV